MNILILNVYDYRKAAASNLALLYLCSYSFASSTFIRIFIQAHCARCEYYSLLHSSNHKHQKLLIENANFNIVLPFCKTILEGKEMEGEGGKVADEGVHPSIHRPPLTIICQKQKHISTKRTGKTFKQKQ